MQHLCGVAGPTRGSTHACRARCRAHRAAGAQPGADGRPTRVLQSPGSGDVRVHAGHHHGRDRCRKRMGKVAVMRRLITKKAMYVPIACNQKPTKSILRSVGQVLPSMLPRVDQASIVPQRSESTYSCFLRVTARYRVALMARATRPSIGWCASCERPRRWKRVCRPARSSSSKALGHMVSAGTSGWSTRRISLSMVTSPRSPC